MDLGTNNLCELSKNEFIMHAVAMADLARTQTMNYFRKERLIVENKYPEGFDPVTIADKLTEHVLRDYISKNRPEDSIIGEEFESTQGQSEWSWVFDPIDGTRAYVLGVPLWGTLIALCYRGDPVLGIIDMPAIDHRYIGGFGLAENRTSAAVVPLSPSHTSELNKATLTSTHPNIGTPNEQATLARVSQHCRQVRYGYDCFGYALVASGYADVVVEMGLQSYDILAPIAVIKACGGNVTNWEGYENYQQGQIIVSANQKLHNQVLAITANQC